MDKRIVDGLREVLRGVVDSNEKRLNSKPLTLFAPQQGTKSRNCGNPLMVVGRAVNGSGDRVGWTPEDFASGKLTLDDELKAATENRATNSGDRLNWVTYNWRNRDVDYNTAKSPFWRTIRGITLGLNIPNAENIEKCWSSYLIWSNLYKVSPVRRGNPDKNIRDIQRESCMKLLRSELEVYKPKRALFVTGNWCLEQLESLCILSRPDRGTSVIERCGRYYHTDGASTTDVVVTIRPEGQKEKNFVAQVISEFKRLEGTFPGK